MKSLNSHALYKSEFKGKENPSLHKVINDVAHQNDALLDF